MSSARPTSEPPRSLDAGADRASEERDALRDLRVAIHSALSPLGFVRSKLDFGLRKPDRWAIVSVQRTRPRFGPSALAHPLGDDERGPYFTFELGVFMDEIAALEGESTQGMPSILKAHWRDRMGRYTERKTDTWWHLTSRAERQGAVDKLTRNGVPVLLEAATDDGLLVALEEDYQMPLPHMYRALVLARLGRADEALADWDLFRSLGVGGEVWRRRRKSLADSMRAHGVNPPD